MGLRYRKNVKTMPGKPDIVFPGARLAIFCDGDFWHGRDWQILQVKLGRGANADYWIAKIGSNIERDHLTNSLLAHVGYEVVRLWESDIRKDPYAVACYVSELVKRRRHKAQRPKTAVAGT